MVHGGPGRLRRARSVLVVQRGAPHALAAARCLARHGWSVGMGTVAGAGWPSRAVRRAHALPAPEDDPDAFVDAVAAVVSREGYEVVLGADDIEVLVLSAARDRLACVVPHPPHDVLLRGLDKLALVRAAETAGLAAPWTEPATPEVLGRLSGPVVVKARWHWRPGAPDASRHVLAQVCGDRAAAEAAAGAVRAAGRDPVVQEHLDGRLTALSVVRDRDGRLLGVAQQETSGLSSRATSCRARTVPVDRDLLARVLALLDELGWWGMANLQLLLPPGRAPHLIDLNPRIYGSLALAVAAGAPLPHLWALVALDEPVDGCLEARAGVRFQALLADLARARRERRHGLLADVAGCLAVAPWSAHPHADPRDPGAGWQLLRDRVLR